MQCNSNKMNSVQHESKKSNRLINESSPYLLQHAYNPVDWHPWGEEALAEAQKENKLLIISVGYAACHWCHVMEHESFEDSLVASVMNENFISIKVDREERPDVDDVYMTAAQLLNGRGGWPLNAIALPDGRPIFAGTYYPKEDWLKILNQIITVKNESPERLEESAAKITEGIQSTNLIQVNTNDFDFTSKDMQSYLEVALASYDKKYGGRTGAPKFPMPNAYEFLMKYYWISGDETALSTVTTGLDNMANGGIYDHLGGGFARYSTDETWLVPHFEKMLYDNGQLVSIYSQAYQLTKNPLYKNVVEETLEYIKREMTSPSNGFYSSLDADSEGEEGKFYVWQKNEIDSILNNEQNAKVFNDYYDVSKNGNWEHTNILNAKGNLEKIAKKNDITIERAHEILTESKAKLLNVRAKRIRPGLDDKVLTSWNALMIAGYVDAYNALGSSEYKEIALQAGKFIADKQLQKDGRLNRNFKDGKSSINAFLDDYALTINAFLKLYQATLDKEWINRSELMTQYCLEHFFNDQTKMFNFTSALDPDLIAKKSEYNDNVIPASNSAMARSLFTLGTLKYNTEYLDKSEQMLKNMLPQISGSQYLSFYSNWMQLLLDKLYAPFEIAIVGSDALQKRQSLAQNYLGNSIILGSSKDENLALLEGKYMEGETMIYVCQNKVCKIPVSVVDKALPLIKHKP